MRKVTRRNALLLPAQAVLAASALGLSEGTRNAPRERDDDLGSGKDPAGPVDFVLWFDTEDYILPASDDAVKRIADFLNGQGIRATFKVVGEKARTLERRHRRDVISALARCNDSLGPSRGPQRAPNLGLRNLNIHLVRPIGHVALEKVHDTSALHRLGDGDADRIQQCWGYIDLGG